MSESNFRLTWPHVWGIAAIAFLIGYAIAIIGVNFAFSVNRTGPVRGTAGHVYTCAEILGPNPRPGHVAIMPPGYLVEPYGLAVWDQGLHLVCDHDGKPVSDKK